MPTDPLPTFAYCLVADNVAIGYVKQATFPSLNLFTFEAPLSFDQRFLDSLSNHGYLPVREWSLITLNTALQETGRVVWTPARVTRIRFPELNHNASTPLRIVVHMAIANFREGGGTTRGANALSRGADPLPFFAAEWTIDGLGSTLVISKMDAFTLGDRASEELVLTINPEASAGPFRNWLSSGNTPRNGSLRLLNTALQAFFTIRFTGLRVRSVLPPVTTHASIPATVRLTRAEIRFEAIK